MRSIVSCPGCRRRLRLVVDQPGKKLRCPACQTPFALGAQTKSSGAGPPEFVAFELFDEKAGDDSYEVVVEQPAAEKPVEPPAPLSVRLVRPSPQPRQAPPRPPAHQPSRDVVTDGFEIVDDKPEPAPPDRHRIPVDFELRIDTLIPDEVRLIDDTGPPAGPAPPAAKAPGKSGPEPPAPSSPKATAQPGPKRGPVVPRRPPKPPLADTLIMPQIGPTAPPPKPIVEHDWAEDAPTVQRPPRAPAEAGPKPKPPAPAGTGPQRPRQQDAEQGFEIVHRPAPPAVKKPGAAVPGYEIVQTPAPPAQRPPQPADPGFEIVSPPPAPIAQRPAANQGFEIIAAPRVPATSRPAQRSSIPVVTAATDEDMGRFELTTATIVGASPGPPGRRSDLDDRDDEFDERSRRDAKREQLRQAWTYVFWGLTALIISMGMTVIGILIVLLGFAAAAVGIVSQSLTGAASGGIIVVVGAILIILHEVVALVGYGLCLGAPTKASARGWAIATMVLALAIIVLQGLNTAAERFGAGVGIPLAPHVAGILSIAQSFCFVFFLRAVGLALRKRWIEDEVLGVLKFALIVAGIIVVAFLLTCGLGALLGMGIALSGSKDPTTAVGAAGVLGILMVVVAVLSFVLVAAVWVKYLLLLLHVRSAVRARLEGR